MTVQSLSAQLKEAEADVEYALKMKPAGLNVDKANEVLQAAKNKFEAAGKGKDKAAKMRQQVAMTEAARSAAEKDRDLLRRRKERTDRDLLDAERELAATREEHVRTQAKVERRAELRRELVRFFLGTPADPSTRDIK